MKKLALFLLTFVIIVNSFSQIYTLDRANENNEITKKQYDSTINCIGLDIGQYIGQDLYLREKSEVLRKYGYEGFIKNYTKSKFSKSNTYLPSLKHSGTSYESIAGKTFKVLDAIKTKDILVPSLNAYFLKLQRKDNNDIVYYSYSELTSENSFPFIVMGFFEKYKNDNINKEFIIRYNSDELYDVRTGLMIPGVNGSKWKCIDVIIENKYYGLAMLLMNEKGEHIVSSGNKLNMKCYETHKVDEYISKFGILNWKAILTESISVGMTKEMVIMSWGEPQKINNSSYNDQWIYNTQYLYFENGILKSYN